MQISVKGRRTAVSEDMRRQVERRFANVAKQVSDLAELEVELAEERNPAIADGCIAEATLHLKGVTLRSRERAPDVLAAIKACAADLTRQVKRHRDKRRRRREARAATSSPVVAEAVDGLLLGP